MAQCAYCKAETQLFENNMPICLQCASEKPANRTVRGRLVRDLSEATLKAESASIEFETVMSDIPSGIPYPDGTQRITNVALRMKIARDGMATAHNRLNDYLNSGIVPEDLKRSG